jgi:FAD/FMN-containing dehydrogenase
MATPSNAAISELRGGFGGPLLGEGDSGYDDARALFNSMIDRRPALIAQCENPEDVKAAFEFARAEGLDVAVRNGGHSVAGASSVDGGLVIDMRRMNAAEVDPDRRTITVGGGARWRDFDRATQPHGLATTGGRVSTTGVAGLTLGGGSGWIERRFGLACDSLLSVELVTPDGREVTASEDDNPELFWALHGGGGNFGVATTLTFQLHEMPDFTAGILVWPSERGDEVLTTYRDLRDGGVTESLGGGFAYITGPPEEFVPEHLQNVAVSCVIVTFTGPEAEAREALAPILELEPEGVWLEEMPYAEFQCAIDDPPGFRNYWSAEYLEALPDDAIARFCTLGETMPAPTPTQHIMFPWGGAIASQAGVWPLRHRAAPWVAHPLTLWSEPSEDEQAIGWTREVREAMRPYATGATYLNFIGDEGGDRVVAAFGQENYDRLARVKAEYDPENVLRLHHNIKPLAAA